MSPLTEVASSPRQTRSSIRIIHVNPREEQTSRNEETAKSAVKDVMMLISSDDEEDHSNKISEDESDAVAASSSSSSNSKKTDPKANNIVDRLLKSPDVSPVQKVNTCEHASVVLKDVCEQTCGSSKEEESKVLDKEDANILANNQGKQFDSETHITGIFQLKC